jgi:hypothetical protein
MSQHDDFDRSLARWFEVEAQPAAAADVLDRALRATSRHRPRPRLYATLGSRWTGDSVGPALGRAALTRTGMRASTALVLLLLAMALMAGAALVGARLLQPSPAVSQLVLNLSADFNEVAVYADGRVVWGPDDRGGYVEQRLSPEGLERLRSRAFSTGLFERDLFATSIGTPVVGSGYIKAFRGDQPVIVAWGTTPRAVVPGLGPDDRFVQASAAQAAEVTRLDAFLRDPRSWALPYDMYVQREITPFIPSHLWVSWDRGTPDWSELPLPAREVVESVMNACANGRTAEGEPEEFISLDQAREIAQALTQAGVPTDYDGRLGLSFSLPSSFVHAHPALPHHVATACGEG